MKLVALWLGNQHATTICSQIQRGIKIRRIGPGWRGLLNRAQERARTSGTLGRHETALQLCVGLILAPAMTQGKRSRAMLTNFWAPNSPAMTDCLNFANAKCKSKAG